MNNYLLVPLDELYRAKKINEQINKLIDKRMFADI